MFFFVHFEVRKAWLQSWGPCFICVLTMSFWKRDFVTGCEYIESYYLTITPGIPLRHVCKWFWSLLHSSGTLNISLYHYYICVTMYMRLLARFSFNLKHKNLRKRANKNIHDQEPNSIETWFCFVNFNGISKINFVTAFVWVPDKQELNLLR